MNLRLSKIPGNMLPPKQSGLPENSVINLTQTVTADKIDFLEFAGLISGRKMEQAEKGMRLISSL